MKRQVSWERQVDEILAAYADPPQVVRCDGRSLSAGEQHCLILEPGLYRMDSEGLSRLAACLLALDSREARDAFWDRLKKRLRHTLVPCFFVATGRLMHLLECLLDELTQEPPDERVIVLASEALKVEHGRYSADELEKLGELVGILLSRSQLEMGNRSLINSHAAEDERHEAMQSRRLKRDIYKAVGTLQEVTRAALYRKLAAMLADS
jgi:hypothetical protein